MATYVKDFQGYVADVPKMWFKRCDGEVFFFDQLTQASVTPSINYTEVNAGWSLYPVAYLPGQSTFEMQITSGKFEADLFAMANNTNFNAEANYEMPVTEVLNVNASNLAALKYVPKAGSIKIKGLKEVASSTASLDEGEFKLNSSDPDEKNILFHAGDIAAGENVEISYVRVIATGIQEAKMDNKSSATGEATLVYPVYGSAESCAVDSSIIGYVIMKVFNCRFTAMPGLDGSYKTAGTYQFTLSAMDPGRARADGSCYSIAYYRGDLFA